MGPDLRHHERQAAQGDYEEFLECDFSFEVPNLARFRVNAFNQNRGSARSVPHHSLQGADAGGTGMRQVFKEIATRHAASCW
jgi:twitching motility protein PilT